MSNTYQSQGVLRLKSSTLGLPQTLRVHAACWPESSNLGGLGASSEVQKPWWWSINVRSVITCTGGCWIQHKNSISKTKPSHVHLPSSKSILFAHRNMWIQSMVDMFDDATIWAPQDQASQPDALSRIHHGLQHLSFTPRTSDPSPSTTTYSWIG